MVNAQLKWNTFNKMSSPRGRIQSVCFLNAKLKGVEALFHIWHVQSQAAFS